MQRIRPQDVQIGVYFDRSCCLAFGVSISLSEVDEEDEEEEDTDLDSNTHPSDL